jgi:hypothetical protein
MTGAVKLIIPAYGKPRIMRSSSDNSCIAYCSEDEGEAERRDFRPRDIRVHDAVTGRAKPVLGLPRRYIRDIALSMDGSRVASVGHHGAIYIIWNAEIGEEHAVAAGHRETVNVLVFRPMDSVSRRDLRTRLSAYGIQILANRRRS